MTTRQKFYAALLVAAGLVVLSELVSFRRETVAESTPRLAPPTKAEERAEAVTLPCEPVVALAPTSRDLAAIRKRYNRPDLGRVVPNSGTATGSYVPGSIARILGERELPELPNGGRVLLTLEPGGRVEATVAPTPERLVAFTGVLEAGALAGVGLGGEARGRGWIAYEPARIGRIHLRLEAGAEVRGGEAGAYGMVGGVWRSR